jgi:hypothetical protein
MHAFLTKISPVTALLYLFVITQQTIAGVYLSSGLEPPPVFTFISAPAYIWILGWWLSQDIRKREMDWLFDMGFFLYLAWPLVLPYHLLRSRGLNGIIVIIGFVAIYVTSFVAGFVLYALLAPSGWPSAFANGS